MRVRYDIHRADTMEQLSYLDDFMRFMETRMDEGRQAEEAHINSRPHPDEDEEYGEWQWALDEHRRRFHDEFIPRMRYSFITLLYSIYDCRGLSFCDEFKSRNGLNASAKDMGGRGTDLIRNYIVKIMNLTIDESIWSSLATIQHVRNCIVHGNGKPENCNKRTANHILHISKREIGVKISESGYLELKPQFCTSAHEAVNAFFDQAFTKAGFGPASPIFVPSVAKQGTAPGSVLPG